MLSFLTLAPFTRAGLDVTDLGFHLANQMMVGRIGSEYIAEQPYWWLSDSLGWLWLSLVESVGMGVLGARLGGVLIFSSCAAIAAHTIARHLRAHWLIPLSALCVAPYYSSFLSLISYDSVPAFLCLLAVSAYLHGLLRSEGRTSLCVASAISGLLLFLVALSRLPATTSLFIPAYVTAVAAGTGRGYARRSVFASSIAYAVAVGLIVGFCLWLSSTDLLAKVLASQVLDATYNRDFIVSVVKSQWALVQRGLHWFLIPSALFLAAFLFPSIRPLRALRGLFAAAAIAGFAAVLYGARLPDLFTGTVNYILLSCLLLLAVVLLVTLLRRQIHFSQSRDLLFKLLSIAGLAFALPAIVSMGSSAGLSKLQFGSFLIPPAVVAVLSLVGERVDAAGRRLLTGFLAGLILLAILFAYQHLYLRGIFRDHPDRQWLTHRIDVPRLQGILTTEGRSRSIAELYEALSRALPARQGSLLVYREAPLVLYLVNAVPFHNWVWPDILPKEQIMQALPALCTRDRAPQLVVRATVPTGNPLWGSSGNLESFAPPWQVEKYAAIDSAVARCGYKVVWRNPDFEILSRDPGSNAVPE